MLVLLAACEVGPVPTDGATPIACTSDADCDDGVFCNGFELCLEDPAGSFCAAGRPPCAGGCDEEGGGCADCMPRDADGDGRAAIGCGGDDCDDADSARAPGREEVCDERGHDEDCIPSSVGLRDDDGDGAVSDACCNGARCGPDCDDGDPTRRPGATETCDGHDEDCDGATDEAGAGCELPGATASECRGGTCVPVTCADGREDCNGAARDGCERALATDHDHCGACDHACGAFEGCVDRVCTPGAACPEGFHGCGGVCAPSWLPATCGSRCEACPVPEGGEAGCWDGECTLACPWPTELVVGADGPRCVPTSATGTILRVTCLSTSRDVVLPATVRCGASPVHISVLSTEAASVQIGAEVRGPGESFSVLSPTGVLELDVVSTAHSGDRATRTLRLEVNTPRLIAFDEETPRSRLGSALALDGDQVVAGAPGADDEAGAVLVYLLGPTGWARAARLVTSLPHPGAHFGAAVAVRGDRVYVGAPDDGAGAVYVFDRVGDAWSETARLTAPAGHTGDRFGAAIALDAAGTRLLVGAPLEDGVIADRGGVYLFEVATGAAVARLTAEQAELGTQVAWAGARTVATGRYGGVVLHRPDVAWRIDEQFWVPAGPLSTSADGAWLAMGGALYHDDGFGLAPFAPSAPVGAPAAFVGDEIVGVEDYTVARLALVDGTWRLAARYAPNRVPTALTADERFVVVSGILTTGEGHVEIFPR